MINILFQVNKDDCWPNMLIKAETTQGSTLVSAFPTQHQLTPPLLSTYFIYFSLPENLASKGSLRFLLTKQAFHIFSADDSG